MNSPAPASSPTSQHPLGIIAGSGDLPLRIVAACRAANRPFFVLAFEEAPDAALACGGPHAVVRLGAIGEALETLRQAGVSELVMAGKVRRPSFSSLRPDKVGAKLVAKLGTALFGGDDALLRAVVSVLEGEGFRITASEEVLESLLAPCGTLGAVEPDAQARRDIARGMEAARALGALDIGQAVIVEHGYILGVEAAEGTDALIERCAPLKREQRAGVLVKLCKPGQDTRVDRPAIGAQTVERVHAAGFAGIAIEAGGAVLLERESLIQKADMLGIFIVGISHEQ